MKAYIASSWFTPAAFEEVETIKSLLTKNGFEYFSPKDFFVCPPSADLTTQKATFEGNVEHILGNDFVICNTRDKDMGSIFEAGVAHQSDTPIVYFCVGLPEGATFNLMLAQSGIKVCTSFEELDDYLSRCVDSEGLIFEPYYGNIE
jgi:nucleoside 2-deoxyribosyltransferase|tara:strand:- start:386 stop:826 length:441 start_codon:yes stop_codon:yes gene_type:complete